MYVLIRSCTRFMSKQVALCDWSACLSDCRVLYAIALLTLISFSLSIILVSSRILLRPLPCEWPTCHNLFDCKLSS